MRSRSLNRGFSLIEALISIVIMVAVILGLLGVIPYGFSEIQVNASQVQAVALGQQYLDGLRNAKLSKRTLPTTSTYSVDQGYSFMNGSANPSSSAFTISPNTCPVVSGTANEYDCAVTVTWTENAQARSVTVESYVTF